MTFQPQVVLHISDLHFGSDKSASEKAVRALALEGLVSAILALDEEWRPTIVCISGDIAWKGRASEYVEAAQWLKDTLDKLSVSPDHVLICAGNHDIDRAKVIFSRPRSPRKADQFLAVPIDSGAIEPFTEYVNFAKAFGIQQLRLGAEPSYLIGQRVLEGITFCSLNSAWFCKNKHDKDNLWVGQPIIDVLEHNGQVPHPDKLPLAAPTIFLLHHPRNWLHQAEIHSFKGRTNTFDMVAARCHLLLTGHTHGESRRPDRNGGAAYIMAGGATYDSSTYNNAFTLIQIHDDHFVYRTFDFDPKSLNRKWIQTIPPSILQFRDTMGHEGGTLALATVPRLDGFRTAFRSYAEDAIEKKSRALKPQGRLPRSTHAFVTVNPDVIKRSQIMPGQVQRDAEPKPVSLIEAIQNAARTLLLGEVGSGKSTLGARVAIESQDRTQDSLALFLPAKLIPPALEGPIAWRTAKELLTSISRFVNDQILPQGGFDLIQLFDSRVETVIVVDGLDEISINTARQMIEKLADAVQLYAGVRILATGRPIELQGLDYGKWQLCTPLPTDDDDKLQFFMEESLAEGNDHDAAIIVAATALERLQAVSELHNMADTPLFCRLLFSQLKEQQSHNASTLGDLLYQLLAERLSQWPSRDGKVTLTAEFDSQFPDADSRVRLLAILASSLDRNGSVPVERARASLTALLPDFKNVGKPQLVDQALKAFESAGLVSLENGGFELSLRSFDDFCRGYALADRAIKDSVLVDAMGPTSWRTVAFAVTMFRRLGFLDRFRPQLHTYLDRVLVNDEAVVPLATVVVESQDEALAVLYIEALKKRGRRPLWFSFQEPTWPQAAQAIAEALRLAGPIGFEWFYREYLDPKYPFVFAGGQLTTEVFLRWAALHIGKINQLQHDALVAMIEPHRSTGSMPAATVIPALALLVPDAFDAQVRLRHCIGFLGKAIFRDAAERQIREAFNQGNRQELLALFSDAIQSNESPQEAALLYLSLSNERPSTRIIRAILTPKRGNRKNRQRAHTLEKLQAILGIEAFQRFCRWYVFDSDSMLAAGAAISLFDLGERRLSFLGNALLQALHDGAFTPSAEGVLATLISDNGPQATEIVVNAIAHADNSGMGGFSAWWRLLLRFIYDPEVRGPELLVACLRGIGEFLIPRNPEIRSSFKDLVLGTRSAPFRQALRDALNHEDPQVRHGAGMILVTADPATEGRALETVVGWKSAMHHGAWFEWEQFCLTLKFGPAVLAHLRSRLDHFSGQARSFALAILFKNGVDLDDALFREMVSTALAAVYRLDVLAVGDQSERIHKVLLELLDGSVEDTARKAAQTLLPDRSESLNDRDRMKCKALILTSDGFATPDFSSDLDRLNGDHAQAELLVQVSQELVSKGFSKPLLYQIYEAQNHPGLWEDILWEELGNSSPIKRSETRGQWIIDFQVRSAASRQTIAQAARKWLFDSRVSQPYGQDDTKSWLGLIAQEGDLLSQQELAELVDSIDPISSGAYVALVARLGRGPDNNKRPRRTYTPTQHVQVARPSAETANLERFLDYARPSPTVPSESCQLIEESLFNQPFDSSELETLAGKSEHGALIASALATCYRDFPRIAWALIVLGQHPPLGQQDRVCADTLFRLWGIALFVAKEDAKWRSEYLSGLKELMPTAEGARLAAAASELLAIEGTLRPEHLAKSLSYLSQTAFDDRGLYPELADWLSKPEQRELLNAVSQTVDRVIEDLDRQPWSTRTGYPPDAGAFLLFPLLHWLQANATDATSKRVFLRGLKMALMPPRDWEGKPHNRFVSIEEILPLLRSIDKSFLEDAIRYGETLEDKELRTLCLLFMIDRES